MNVLVINGVNLNLLGTREPHIYGAETLAGVSADLDKTAAELGVGNTDWIIINAGAFTHTSVAIRDALAGVGIPFVEVHISNVHAREAFRHHSYLSDKAVGVIVGLGTFGYQAALQFVARKGKAA